ncbi:ABC transporter substrate-binding protein [Caniella muris]|uniref:ABC transporter substrate-binding protein n=1 Tax=Caniella muris TaxID=2941502 RepID=UPI002041DD2E|nr:extracellular solute-binding protein [Caniella muris]
MACTRRAFVAACGLGVASLATLGCSRWADSPVFYAPEAEAAQSVTLTVLGTPGPYLGHSPLAGAVDPFMGENPEVLLTYDEVEGDLYATAFERRLSTGHLDDVFTVDPAQARMVADAGLVCDLSSIAGADAVAPFAAEALTDGEGRLAAVPTRTVPFALFRSDDRCRAEGLSAPGTLDGLLGLCRSWDGGAPLLEGDARSLARALVLGPSLLSLGTGAHGVLTGDGGRLPAMASAGLRLLERLVATGAVALSAVRPGSDGWGASSAFAAGRTPFMVAGSWAVDALLRERPDLAWSMGPLPGPDGRTFGVCDLDGCVAVNGGSERRDHGVAFVEHLLRPEADGSRCDDGSCYPALSATEVEAGPHRLAYGDLVAAGRMVAANGLWCPDGLDDALDGAVEAVFSGASAEDALAALTAAVS